MCLSVCLIQRHLEYLNHYIHEDKRNRHWKKENSKEKAFAIISEIFLGGPPSTT